MANKRFKRQEYARYKKLGIKWRRPSSVPPMPSKAWRGSLESAAGTSGS